MTSRAPHLISFVFLTALTVISTNMFLAALPAMRVEFGVSEGMMGLSISAYMAVAAVLQLVLGPLSDRVGRRPVILCALAVYAFASLVCVTASSFEVFLAGRVAQAVAVSGGVLASAMVRDLYEGRAAATKLATIASAMAVAPMLAPMIGGGLEVLFGWRAIFLLMSALGVGLFVWLLHDLSETLTPEAVAAREPFGNLLKAPRFWGYGLCQSLGVGGFFIFLTGAPFVAAEVYGLNAAQIGIGLGSITMGFLCASALSARIVGRVGPARLMIAGRVLALVGLSVGLLLFLSGDRPVWMLFATTVFVGLGNGLTLPNANVLALSVRPRLAGSAAGLVGALGNVSGAVFSSLATFVLTGNASPERFFLLIMAAVLLSLLAGLFALWRERDTARASQGV